MPTTLLKLSVPLAPLLPRLEFDATVTAALAGAKTAAEGVSRLQAEGLRNAAVRLSAHALPKREAVWWACMCARAVPDPALGDADTQALIAAESWVRKPGEESLRRAAWDAAQKAELRSPEAWAAAAAFWSGGSIAPEGQPVVPPAEHLTGVAVSGGIVMAAVRGRPERADARLERFINSAREIAEGGAGRIEPENVLENAPGNAPGNNTAGTTAGNAPGNAPKNTAAGKPDSTPASAPASAPKAP